MSAAAQTAPLGPADVDALAATLRTRTYQRGAALFHGGNAVDGVWIVQRGRVELSVGAGRRRAVVYVLQPGDVDGDIQHLLDMPLTYTARALDEVTALSLDPASFEKLLAEHPLIARRWLSSVAQRLATSQSRIIGLLGRSLTEQVARLLLDEAVDGAVPLPQRTLAAMLGAQRPSLNKILKEFERAGLIEVRYAAIQLLDPANCSPPPDERVHRLRTRHHTVAGVPLRVPRGPAGNHQRLLGPATDRRHGARTRGWWNPCAAGRAPSSTSPAARRPPATCCVPNGGSVSTSRPANWPSPRPAAGNRWSGPAVTGCHSGTAPSAPCARRCACPC